MIEDYKGAANEGHTRFVDRVLNENEALRKYNKKLKDDVRLLLWCLGTVSVCCVVLVERCIMFPDGM